MKRIAAILTVPEPQLRDLLQEQQWQLTEKYDEVLNSAIEQHLCRSFNAELDKDRISCVSVAGRNQDFYFIDDKLIGVIKQDVFHNNDDFVKNLVSVRVQFTPVNGEIEQCPKCKFNSLVWETCLGCECAICNWRPVSIPWDEDDI